MDVSEQILRPRPRAIIGSGLDINQPARRIRGAG
jgi:hypothetical protein